MEQQQRKSIDSNESIEEQICEWSPTQIVELDEGELDEELNICQDKTTDKDSMKKDKSCKKRLLSALRLTVLLILLAGICTFFGLFLLDDSFEDGFIEVLSWMTSLPTGLSAGIMILLYSVSLLFFCPGTPFNMAAGFLYGIVLGCTVALAGCILGAVIAFVLGRTIARDWVKAKMESKPKFKAVDWALRKNGLYIVFLTRLSPLFPFPLLNYAFGVTQIKSWQYLLGTALGVTPGTIGYTYLGTLMRNVADLWSTSVSDEDGEIIWWAVGGGLTLLSIIAISIITQRAISNATKEYEKLHEDENSNDMKNSTSSLELKNLLQEKEDPSNDPTNSV